MGQSVIERLETGEQIGLAKRDVIEWGYPREIDPFELVSATWFRIGPSVVTWFEHYDVLPETCFVHLAVSPAARMGRWPARSWLRFIDQHALSVGAKELGVVLGDATDGCEDFLLRLSWGYSYYGLAYPVEVN